MTRAELSDATRRAPSGKPVSTEMIAKIEQGRKGPSVSSLRSLAFGLGVDISDLSERAHAWQAAATAGVGTAALRAGTVAGALTSAALAPAVVPIAVGAAAGKVIRSQLHRRKVESALRARVSELSDEDLAALAVRAGVDLG